MVRPPSIAPKSTRTSRTSRTRPGFSGWDSFLFSADGGRMFCAHRTVRPKTRWSATTNGGPGEDRGSGSDRTRIIQLSCGQSVPVSNQPHHPVGVNPLDPNLGQNGLVARCGKHCSPHPPRKARPVYACLCDRSAICTSTRAIMKAKN